MVYTLSYRRPAYVNSDSSTEATDSDREYQSEGSSRTSLGGGIPEALAFEKIIEGGTCPPCTTRDFMNYLLHVERAAENLQFFLWHRDYTKRFNEAGEVETKLAPEWTQAQQDAALQEAQAQASAKKKMMRKSMKEAAEILKGTDFADETKTMPTEKRGDPFDTPPGTADIGSQKAKDNPWDSMGSLKATSTHVQSNADTYRQKATEAFQTSGLKKPFTVQPFREEIERVIGTYIAEDSPRELNLSSRQRYAVMRALEYTTHPSAFAAVQKTIEESLRNQAHRNFIRWAICNGNRARWLFARGLGIGVMVFGIVAAVLITLSGVPRAWRVLPIILHIVGLATLIAGWKGMCVVLHGMHHRHLRPWELFEDSEEECKGRDSMDSFGSGYSYEDEPWVIKYDKRNVVRKVFDKEVWIEEPALRQIQDTIFIQSMLCAILYGGVLTAIFVAVPGGHFY